MHEDEIGRRSTIHKYYSKTANAVTKDTCSDGSLRDMPTELLCTHQGQPSVNKLCDHWIHMYISDPAEWAANMFQSLFSLIMVILQPLILKLYDG